MEVEDLIKRYLGQGRAMQIATMRDDQPWVCTVYYIEDENQNLYWLSLPDRRHSREIAKHNKIAVAIPIKVEQPVIGLQAEGVAAIVADVAVISKIMERYTERHKVGNDFYNNFLTGKNQHVLYRFIPTNFGLFDEVTFNDGVRREWITS